MLQHASTLIPLNGYHDSKQWSSFSRLQSLLRGPGLATAKTVTFSTHRYLRGTSARVDIVSVGAVRSVSVSKLPRAWSADAILLPVFVRVN
jgi:hypothetical protein